MAEDPNDPSLEKGKKDPDEPSPKVAPPPGEKGKGEDDLEKEKGKVVELSDEELEELIIQEEAETLQKLGLGQFKSVGKLVEGYKDLQGKGTKVFNQVKKIAETYDMTADQLIEHLEGQVSKVKPKPKEDDKGKEEPKYLKEVQDIAGRTELNRLFDKFQTKMEKEDVEIPDDLQSKLEKYIPLVIHGKTAEQLKHFNPFPEAHKYYLFKLNQEGSAEKLEEQLEQHKALLLKKKRQLGMPTTEKGKKLTPAAAEERKSVWGIED